MTIALDQQHEPLGVSPGVIAPECRISRADIVDADRMITAGWITAGTEMCFHLLRRAGYGEEFIEEVAGVMEYCEAYRLYKDDVEIIGAAGAA